jgi:hypothetical protein
MAKLTDTQLRKFQDLLCRLSPENLHCDGEISMAQARRKASALRKQWKDLEKQVGRKVTEHEIWG